MVVLKKGVRSTHTYYSHLPLLSLARTHLPNDLMQADYEAGVRRHTERLLRRALADNSIDQNKTRTNEPLAPSGIDQNKRAEEPLAPSAG